MNAIVTENPAAATDIADDWLYLALCEPDPAAANRALAAMKPGVIAVGHARFPRSWFEGVAARTRGEDPGARNAFAAARVEAERMARDQPEYGSPLAVLGVIEAALGHKEDLRLHPFWDPLREDPRFEQIAAGLAPKGVSP